MAKLSDRQKNNILAQWNTGTFTKVFLAKKYKVDEKIIRNIIDGQEPKHKALVDEQLLLNERKKSELSPSEIRAVNSAVSTLEKNREYISNLTILNLKGVEKLVNKKKAQKVVTEGQGMGVSMARVIEHDLQSIDHKNIQDIIDKASITLGVNERFSSSKVEVNNANVQETKEIIYKVVR